MIDVRKGLTYDESLEMLQELAKQQGGDIEGQHGEADDILCAFLCKLGYGELVDVYDNIEKWYA